MLQKMGWSEGKGLGLNEDGVTESIKLRRKQTLAGIGAKANAASMEAWKVPAQVSAGLNDVLAKLAADNADSTVAAPEASRDSTKSTTRESRGYHQRRAARKNVRNYSATALQEIFGIVAQTPLSETKTEPKDEQLSDSARDQCDNVASSKEQERLDRLERKRLRREKREKKAAAKKLLAQIGGKSKIKKKRKHKDS